MGTFRLLKIDMHYSIIILRISEDFFYVIEFNETLLLRYQNLHFTTIYDKISVASKFIRT